MKVEVLPTGAFDVNTWLVLEGRAAIVLDPGEAAPVLRALRAAHADLAAILLTHGHVDHLYGLMEILQAQPVPVFLHMADMTWAFLDDNRMPPWYPLTPTRPADLRPLPTDILDINGAGWRTIPTPGHTPGSVCYLLETEKLLFSGDTLFREGVGRTDLPGGNADALFRSIKRLMQLPDDIRVLPGHGAATTIGHERRYNPFIRMG